MPALAQNNESPADAATALPAVRAKASGDGETATSPVPGYTARRSATATKTDTPLIETPQSISVIGAEQVRDQGSQNMQEALRYTAGVRAQMYGIDNRGDWFSLRGGSEGSVLLDGLRLPLSGWWGILRNEPYAFERIEVLRGPASVIAGQNGPGGVVNLVSKRPQAEAAREIGIEVGSHDHKRVSADLTGPLNADGSLLYRLVALGKDSDSQVKYAYDERSYVAPSLTWKPRPGTELTAYAQYQKDKSGNLNAFFPLAGTLLPAPNGPIPRDTFIGEPDWDRYGGTRERIGYQFEQRLDEHWTLRHNLRVDHVDGEMKSMYAAWWEGFLNANGTPNPNGTYLNRYWYVNEDRVRIANADLLFEGRLKSGAVQHTLLVGGDGMRMDSDHRELERAGNPIDIYNPVYGTFPEPALDASAPATRSRTRRLGLLLQDQMKIDERWVVVAGLRRDTSRTDGQRDDATSKNLGLVMLAGGGWAPYANYSESFEPVAGRDPGGAPYKPLRGKQLEAGIKWQPDSQRVAVSAAVYRLVEKNRLATGPSAFGPQVQRGEATVKGLELEASATLPDWDLLASYSYTDAQITSTTAGDVRYLGQQLYGIPRHMAGVWAQHKFGRWGLPGLRAALGANYVSAAWDGIGRYAVPAVTLVDALIAYQTGPWELSLNVNNLTDRQYVAACLERGDCWFGRDRQTTLALTYRW